MPIFNNFYLDSQKNLGPTVLKIGGPLLSVSITVPTKIAEMWNEKGQTVPQPKLGYGLVDTGASVTCVDATILDDLGIPKIGINTDFRSGLTATFL